MNEVPSIPQDINPFGPDHYSLLQEILQSCKNTELLCQGAQYCGLEAGQSKDQNAAQQEVCRKLKQVFFSMQP